MVDLVIPKVSKKVLKHNHPKIKPVFGSFNKLCLKDSCIDFIIEIGSLHHSSDLSKTLSEANRVLRNGGTITCFDRAHNDKITDEEIDDMLSIEYSNNFLKSNGYPQNKKLTRLENGEHEIRISEWKDLFIKNGFEINKVAFFINPSRKNMFKGFLF